MWLVSIQLNNISTVFLQFEQNSSMHVGHRTETTATDIKELDSPATPLSIVGSSTTHTVSQPAFGHHVRLLSKSISTSYEKIREMINFILFVFVCGLVFHSASKKRLQYLTLRIIN